MEDTTIDPANRDQPAQGVAAEPVAGQEVVIPVIEERIRVEKKLVESGRVRISKKLQVEEETVDIPVLQEEVVVERVPVHQFVETAPQIRYEGDTMIVPVVREVVVVEKRIELIEELHITKRTTQTQVSQQIDLRKEEVIVERLPGEMESSPSPPDHKKSHQF